MKALVYLKGGLGDVYPALAILPKVIEDRGLKKGDMKFFTDCVYLLFPDVYGKMLENAMIELLKVGGVDDYEIIPEEFQSATDLDWPSSEHAVQSPQLGRNCSKNDFFLWRFPRTKRYMKKQFDKKSEKEAKVKFLWQRIDLPFELGKQFDKVFISFVIHGFPHEVRDTVIKNAYNHLKPGGSFIILDFAEFDMGKMSGLHRFIFKKIECKYAFDYIKRDWKTILKEYAFDQFYERFYVSKYVRLLAARKI